MNIAGPMTLASSESSWDFDDSHIPGAFLFARPLCDCFFLEGSIIKQWLVVGWPVCEYLECETREATTELHKNYLMACLVRIKENTKKLDMQFIFIS